MKLNKMFLTVVLSGMLFSSAHALDLGGVRVAAGSASGDTGKVWDRQAWTQEVSYRPGVWDFSVGHIAKQEEVGSYGYLSAQRVFTGSLFNTGLEPFVGVGGVVRSNGTNVSELLPQVVNFSLSAGVAYGKVSVEYRHFGTLGLDSDDRGQNFVLLGYRF